MVYQEKPTEELQQLLKAITDRMETAASAGDHRTAREGLIQSMERISESLAAPAAGTDRTERGKTRTTWTDGSL